MAKAIRLEKAGKKRFVKMKEQKRKQTSRQIILETEHNEEL